LRAAVSRQFSFWYIQVINNLSSLNVYHLHPLFSACAWQPFGLRLPYLLSPGRFAPGTL
jgi:hypothetical protein